MRKKTEKQRLIEECVSLATQLKLAEHPSCVFCGKTATTCHHFVRQSRSNFLRCNPKNLIPVCQKCHAKIHIGQEEQIMTLRLRNMFGKRWSDEMEAGRQKTIKSDIYYWKKMKILLTEKANQLIK